jgi:hypothetical protein
MGFSDEVDTRKASRRYITAIFVIFIASLLLFFWTAPLFEGSIDAPVWLIVSCVGSLIGIFYTGVMIFSYVTGIPIGEGGG